TILETDVTQYVQNDINAAPQGAKTVPVTITFQDAQGHTTTQNIGARTGDLSTLACKNAQNAVIKDNQGNALTGQGPGVFVFGNPVAPPRHYPLTQIPGLAVQQAGVMLGG